MLLVMLLNLERIGCEISFLTFLGGRQRGSNKQLSSKHIYWQLFPPFISYKFMRLIHITGLLFSCVIIIQAQQAAPVLLTKGNSTRAIAFDSIMRTTEPFSLTTEYTLSWDRRTRVLLFARNLTLRPGEAPSVVAARAEDQTHRSYALRVEYVGPVPGQDWMSAVIVRLSDVMADDVGDVLVQITYRGASSNRVRINIGKSYALAFDGSTQSINHDGFWQPDVDLGKFFYEVWVKPGTYDGTRYILSDGIGGAHAILFGLGGSETTAYLPVGNTFNGDQTIPFGGDDGPTAGEWAHLAVGWDGNNIVTYYNGVPVGSTAFVGQRFTLGSPGGGGRLFIGGSNHQNFLGSISQVRAYEGSNPLQDFLGTGKMMSAFTPQTVFEAEGCSFLASLLRPAQAIADLSGNNHPGTFLTWAGGPLPTFILDPITPNVSIPPADIPLAVPPVVRVFDSFSRPNATYAFDNDGGLGSTEFGLNGQQTWCFGSPSSTVSEPTNFGILNGRAVVLSNGPGVAWVPMGSGLANLDIRVSRHASVWGSGLNTGLAFRLKDAQNFCFAYTSGEVLRRNILNVGCYHDGARSLLISPIQMPDYVWTNLRVVTTQAGGAIYVYADQELVTVTSTSWLVNETGAGLYNDTYGLGLTNRWDNFAVLPVP